MQEFWPWPGSTVQTPRGPVAITDTGDGPTLLLVHVGLGSFLWRDLIRELGPSFRCVTLDAPGTGRSPATDFTLTAAADAVAAVIEELDLRDITLVIHDLGGPAGIAAAARTPERIAAIAAVNTFAWRPTGRALRGMLAVMGSGIARETDALVDWLPRLTATRFGVGRHWSRAERSAFRATFGKSGRRALHRYFVDARRNDDIFRLSQAALEGPLRDRPLLTVFGQRNDPLNFQPRWKAVFPAARQHVIPRGYHFPMCDAPDTVAAHLRALVASLPGRQRDHSGGP